MDQCQHCRSIDLLVIPGPHPGGHFGKIQCGRCGRFVRFMPDPARMPLWAAFRGVGAMPMDSAPRLVGTLGEARFAAGIRRRLLRRILDGLGAEAYRAARTIDDARWWIANQGRAVGRIEWPREWFEAASVG